MIRSPATWRPWTKASGVALVIMLATALPAVGDLFPPWVPVLLGVVSGALTWLGSDWQQRHQEDEQANKAWESAVTHGPAVGGATTHQAAHESLLTALNPDQEVVPFSPLHLADLRRLVDWCHDDGDRRVWMVTGAAGSGKTRLLLEATHRLTEEGWRCGWVRRGKATDAVEAADRQSRRPVLLVVDDADTYPDQNDLASMLTAVVGADPTSQSRVVLAGRDFGGWWVKLGAGLDPVVHSRLPTGRIHRTVLAAHVSKDDQQQLFAHAVRRYSRHFGVPQPTVVLTGMSPKTPLAEIHAVAAVVAYHGLTGPVPMEDALQELFVAEELWLQENAADRGIRLRLPVLQAAIAAATLIGAADQAEMMRRLRCLPGLTTAPDSRLEGLASWLHQVYRQRGNDWVDLHLPAFLAERYAARCVASLALS